MLYRPTERPLPGPVHRPAAVDDRRAQVSQGLVTVAEPWHRPIQPDERLLHDVLSGRLIADEHHRGPDQGQAVCLVEAGDHVGRTPVLLAERAYHTRLC